MMLPLADRRGIPAVQLHIRRELVDATLVAGTGKDLGLFRAFFI